MLRVAALPRNRRRIRLREWQQLPLDVLGALGERANFRILFRPALEGLVSIRLDLNELADELIDRRTLEECRISGELARLDRSAVHVGDQLPQRAFLHLKLGETRADLRRALELDLADDLRVDDAAALLLAAQLAGRGK